MNRSHGATVVGSMIDEVASGNAEFINMLFLTAPLKENYLSSWIYEIMENLNYMDKT